MGEMDDGTHKQSCVRMIELELRACLDKMFHFTCFNVDPEDDPSVGLINGELAIPGNLLRREVFDPVVNQVSIPQSAALHLGRYEGTDMPAWIRILRS